MKKLSMIIIIATFIGLFAGEPQKHDGFYLRIQTGIGTGYAKYEDLFELYGGAGLLSFHFGGAVSENLIIFGKVNSSSMTDPDVTFFGTLSGETNDTTYDVSGIGAGVNYYLPYNFYISGSVDFPVATLKIGSSEGSSDAGLGGEICLGKEWWVSDNWGLGLAITGQLSGMKDKGEFEDNDIGNSFIGLVFSATYN